MKKFIVNLFSNRFGIVLATLNVCFFALKSSNMASVPETFLGKVFVSLNLPAFIFTRLCYEIPNALFAEISYSARMNLKFGLFASFIVLQWLFIAWIAKTLAQKFRPTEL